MNNSQVICTLNVVDQGNSQLLIGLRITDVIDDHVTLVSNLTTSTYNLATLTPQSITTPARYQIQLYLPIIFE